MKQFIAQIRALCEHVVEGFMQARLTAELPDADKRPRGPFDYSSDDSRASGPPIIGVL